MIWIREFNKVEGVDLAWDQAPHCGKKEKKSAFAKKTIGERSEPRVTDRSARVARRYFSLFDLVFCLFPHCGAWSQARVDQVALTYHFASMDKVETGSRLLQGGGAGEGWQRTSQHLTTVFWGGGASGLDIGSRQMLD